MLCQPIFHGPENEKKYCYFHWWANGPYIHPVWANGPGWGAAAVIFLAVLNTNGRAEGYCFLGNPERVAGVPKVCLFWGHGPWDFLGQLYITYFLLF